MDIPTTCTRCGGAPVCVTPMHYSPNGEQMHGLCDPCAEVWLCPGCGYYLAASGAACPVCAEAQADD